jgi:hypothetical protein
MDREVALNSFIAQFQLPRDGFKEAVKFTDAFGFSTDKDREQNGHEFVSIYKFYIRNEEIQTEAHLKSVVIVVSYGEKISDGTVRLHPTSIERKLNWPLDFISTDEFYFDITAAKFIRDGKEIDAKTILKMTEELHLRPTRTGSGFLTRLKIFLVRKVVTNLFKFLYNVLIYLLYGTAGIWTHRSIWTINLDRNRPKDKPLVHPDSFPAQKISIFGYSASAWSVVSYCLIHLSLFTLWFFCGKTNIEYVKILFKNSFLTILYVIPSLVVYEKLVPAAVETAITFAGKMFHEFSFRRIDLKF